ncbi:MAG: dTDP-4-dehydrorhamnose reductase [Thiohalomonadaceae bacterium]
MLLGAGGQVGRALLASVPTGVEVEPLPHRVLDIADADDVERAIARLKPALVINAAGYTAVDRAEMEPELAFAANGRGVAYLTAACARHNIRLVHISTDYVFDGEASRPYCTDAPCSPINFYGFSKLAGELAVHVHARALVVRTSRIYSSHGRNFVSAVLPRLAQKRRVHAVHDQIAAPTSARCLARYLWRAGLREDITGVRHWTDAGEASWYDWACAIRSEGLALGLLHNAPEPTPVASSNYPTAARRPPYTVLETETSAREIEFEPLPWRTGLRAVLMELNR